MVIHKSTFTKVCGGLLCEESIDFLSKLNIAPQPTKTHLEIVDFDNDIRMDTGRILLSVDRLTFVTFSKRLRKKYLGERYGRHG